MNGAGDAALIKMFTHLAEMCATRADFDRRCRPVLRAIAYHQNGDEKGELRRAARRIYFAVRGQSQRPIP
jgi:hypothetical protein